MSEKRISCTRAINMVRTGPPEAPAVILVHPAGLDLTYWSAQIEALGEDHDVIAFDLPGHGRTSGGPADWTLENTVATLAQVIRSNGVASAHLVGLSLGGMIAQALALAEPTMVRSLALIGTAAGFSDEARAALRARGATTRDGGMHAVLSSTVQRWFTATTIARRPDLIERVIKTLLADDRLVHAAVWDMIAALDLLPMLHRIACPTLILVGEHDPSTPPSSAEILERLIPGAHLHVIADASHMAPLEKPAIVNAQLLEFLWSLRNAPTAANSHK